MTRPKRALADAREMRALAHPVRVALLELLGRDGPMTATQAGDALGESPANTSFHLRTLAKYGFVEEAPGGTGRQRPWQRVAQAHTWDYESDDPATVAAAEGLSRFFDQRIDERRGHVAGDARVVPEGSGATRRSSSARSPTSRRPSWRRSARRSWPSSTATPTACPTGRSAPRAPCRSPSSPPATPSSRRRPATDAVRLRRRVGRPRADVLAAVAARRPRRRARASEHRAGPRRGPAAGPPVRRARRSRARHRRRR